MHTHSARTRRLSRGFQALILSAGLLAGAAATGSAAHASQITPPPPIHFPCWNIPNQARITIDTMYSTIGVWGSCFLGTTDYLAVYDQTQGRYLTGGWETVTTNSAGNFAVVVPGANCYDHIEAIGYDSGWNNYTNNGNWQYATLQCAPR